MKHSPSQPLVSVILLNWNGIDDTLECIKSIHEQTYKNYEIIVVDNGSVDDSVERLLGAKEIKLIQNKKNRGFTGGHIDGLAHAHGEFILILNNDAVLKPDLIEVALDNFSDPSVGAVGGRAYFWNADNPPLDESNQFYSYQYINNVTAEAIFYQKDYGTTEEVNTVSGSCAMIRKSVIDELGYLDNDYFAYYEEADLFARYKRAGYKIIYDPGVRIWHKIGASSERKSSSFMYYMLFRNRFFFAIRHFDSKSMTSFLRAYISFGIKSIIKSALGRGDQSINKPFARAFVYNLVHFPRSFSARRELQQKLGESSYNSLIAVEQSNISHLIQINSENDFPKIIEVAAKLRPSHEIVIVTELSADHVRNLPSNVRIIHDKRYFNTHPENLAAIAARYDWIAFTSLDGMMSPTFISDVDSLLSSMLTSRHEVSMETSSEDSNQDHLNFSRNHPLIMLRKHLLDFQGLPASLPLTKSLLLLTVYIAEMGRSRSATTENTLALLKRHGYKSEELSNARLLIKQAFDSHKSAKPPRFYEPVFDRFYRLQQIRYIFQWLPSSKIAPRVKLGRTKNIVIGAVTLDKKKIAFHMKHIRTEVLLAKGIVRDLSEQHKVARKSYDHLYNVPADIPVYIICRDRLSPLKQLIGWLEAAGMKKIVLIDNDSAYPELAKYLSATPYQVIDMKRNAGHTVAWSQSIVPILSPADYYIVSDPDVIPAISPSPDILRHLLTIHKEYPNHLKVGFGLKIDNLPDTYSLKESVMQWERQFWDNELSAGIFEAGVDTTFALYKPFVYDYIIHPSLRLGEPYTARHLPWYQDDSKMDPEDIFYRLHADQNVNTWNKGKLPERYIKELKKLERKR